jgi:hypothetical protein
VGQICSGNKSAYCLNGGEEINGEEIPCDCCLKGLKVALQYAYDLGKHVTIYTIRGPSNDPAISGEFIIGNVSSLVQFEETQAGKLYTKTLPVCNIEYIVFDIGNGEGEIPGIEVDSFINGLVSALNEIIIPEACSECCSEELRHLLEIKKDTQIVDLVDTHEKNVFSNQEQFIEGTGQGVVVLYEDKQNPQNITVLNLCYVSQIILNNI